MPVAGDGVAARARLGSGVVAFSLGSGWMRVATPAELDAASALADRLRDPELGLPSASWLDREWQAAFQGALGDPDPALGGSV